MKTASVDQVQAELPQLLEDLGDGEELVITVDNQPIGRLLKVPSTRSGRTPGRGKGKLTINNDDDEHLKDFAEYTS